jgi:hypothetical protein
MTSRPAISGNGYGICGKLSRLRRSTFQQIPQPRRRRDEIYNAFPDRAESKIPFPGEHYLLDTSLLMGGTFPGTATLLRDACIS